MPMIKLTSEDRVFTVDFSRFTLGEATVLQKQLGVEIDGLAARVQKNDLDALGAVMWLIELRRVAAEKGVTTRRAAEEVPYEDFADGLDIVSLRTEVIEDPKDPSPGTKTTRTRRTTSSATRRRGSSAAASGAEPSPSS
jgi:hypothetical protein